MSTKEHCVLIPASTTQPTIKTQKTQDGLRLGVMN